MFKKNSLIIKEKEKKNIIDDIQNSLNLDHKSNTEVTEQENKTDFSHFTFMEVFDINWTWIWVWDEIRGLFYINNQKL